MVVGIKGQPMSRLSSRPYIRNLLAMLLTTLSHQGLSDWKNNAVELLMCEYARIGFNVVGNTKNITASFWPDGLRSNRVGGSAMASREYTSTRYEAAKSKYEA